MLNVINIDKNIPADLNYQVGRSDWDILKKTHFTCSCCGFRSAPSKQVISGYTQVIEGSTYCAICASAQQLHRPIKNLNNHGFIIKANDLTQGQVSNLCQQIGIARLSEIPERIKRAKEVYNLLLTTEITPDDYSFLSTDNPQTCVELASCFEVMPKLSDVEYKRIFQDLRYVPALAAYDHIFQYWKNITT
jgi:hypothetical protein